MNAEDTTQRCPSDYGCSNALEHPLVRNALSRRRDEYVCRECGAREALDDYVKTMGA